MRWTPGGLSRDVEDRRGASGGGRLVRGGGIGLGGLVILGVLSLVTGQNFFALLDVVPQGGAPGGQAVVSPEDEQRAQFVSFVLDDAQGTWQRLLPEHGTAYRNAKLVLFRDAIDSGCGFAEAASGPFYCPLDEKVYVDLGFYDELAERFGAAGDFAQAYVIAHEIGHHVQTVLGIERRVRDAQRADRSQANALSVRMELQADCLAGVWAHSTRERDLLESGDVEEGLGAASAVGDDRIQRSTTGRVSPETFTHGSARERAGWFRRGLESGRIAECDTFAAG